ncbi:MAG: BPSS1780 family membrane protein [Gammaproteobacteria bacterium]
MRAILAPKEHPETSTGGFMQAKNVDAGRGLEWYGDGWRVFMHNPGIWIALIVIYAVIFIVLSFIPFIGSLALSLIAPALVGGLIYSAREAVESRPLDVAHLFVGLTDPDKRVPLLILGAVCVAATLIMLFVFTGSVGAGFLLGTGSGQEAQLVGGGMGALFGLLLTLLIALALTTALLYAIPLVMFADAEPVVAMKASIEAVLKNWVPLLLFGVIYIILAFIAMLPIFLGFLVLGPVTIGAVYMSYRDIFGDDSSAEEVATPA